MIGTIRKHSNWLWAVIISVTVFTFVYWGSQSGRYDARQRRGIYGSIDGEPITADEFDQARREIFLRHFLTTGSWPDRNAEKSGFDPEREIYQWLFFVRKLKEYHIAVDSRSVARAVNEVLRGFGGGNSWPFDEFVKKMLAPHGIGAEDLERHIRRDLAVQQLLSVAGLSGRLVTPEAARFLYERDHQQYVTEAVFFTAETYLDRVTNISPDAVEEFYTNEMSAYHLPERVQVSYVAFDVSNFLAAAEVQLTNLNDRVENALERLNTNYVRFGKTPDEAKAAIRKEFIYQTAVEKAEQQANDFANELFSLEPEQAANLAAVAATNSLVVRVTEPFDEQNGPREFDGGPDFARAAFVLTPESPFPEKPLVGKDAVYVIAFSKRLPDEILPLSGIRDRVTADYRHREAVRLARRDGGEFVRAGAKLLAEGKPFTTLCADSLVKPVVVPPFSLSTDELPEVENRVDLRQYKQVASTTTPKSISDFSPTLDGGFVVYVRERVPVDPAQMARAMPAFMNLLRRARQQEAFNLWVNKEASISLRNTPLAQRKQSPAGPAGQIPQ